MCKAPTHDWWTIELHLSPVTSQISKYELYRGDLCSVVLWQPDSKVGGFQIIPPMCVSEIKAHATWNLSVLTWDKEHKRVNEKPEPDVNKNTSCLILVSSSQA